ncbi:S-adenosyl-L-methionine-dependent methyltransferase [Boletus edulis]|nr:S-adenosyl-L-methionine-dependent methyltransferase [Boletus edulis]
MADTVKATGPLSFATYMQLCLSHPVHGYYKNPSNPVFGARGDFVTSPEISQVFGEVLALWMIGRWMSAGSKPFRIVELGPGRGSLMADILRVVHQLPAVRPHLDSVHLVETSPTMRAFQRTTLRTAPDSEGRVALMWHDALDEVPHRDDLFTMLVAHEFFDALPVHKTTQGWHEVLIAPANDPGIRYARPSGVLTPSSSSSSSSSSGPPPALQSVSPRWTRVLSPTPTASSTLLGHASPRFAALPVGARIEVSGASIKVARQIAELLSSSHSDSEHDSGSGCALVIDYGAEKAVGNSLRAFKEHEIVDVFHRPGECDVTANVDFALLKEVLADLVTPHGTLSQGTFLNEVGVQLRADRLIKAAPTGERRTAIAESVNRLVDPLGMGGQYAVLGMTTTPKEEAVWPFLHAHDMD